MDPNDAAVTMLCTGDLHLGRQPSRIPETLDANRFSPTTVWHTIVDLAIEEAVDVVVITGDVIDRENRFFEAYGPFEQGVRRLIEADIPIVLVSGNHDYDTLPDVVSHVDVDDVHLLGTGGEWERLTLPTESDPLVHFDGWSYPDRHVLTSPLETYDVPTDSSASTDPAASPDPAASTGTGVPTVGILHGELDGHGSEYAPVTSGDLRGTAADCWLLGHIHAPGVRIDTHPFVLYPGSPQPLDPGETGPHGPWLLSVDVDGSVDAEQVPLATVRYEGIDVDVSGIDTHRAVGSAIGDAIDDRLAEWDAVPELLLARIRATGRTDLATEIDAKREAIVSQLALDVRGTTVRVDTFENDVRPAVDLTAIAQGDGPAAYVARLLQTLENDSELDNSGVDDSELDNSGVDDSELTDPDSIDSIDSTHGAAAPGDLVGDSSSRASTRDSMYASMHDNMGDDHGSLLTTALDGMRDAHASNAYAPLRRAGATDPPTKAEARRILRRQARLLLETLLTQEAGTDD